MSQDHVMNAEILRK